MAEELAGTTQKRASALRVDLTPRLPVRAKLLSVLRALGMHMTLMSAGETYALPLPVNRVRLADASSPPMLSRAARAASTMRSAGLTVSTCIASTAKRFSLRP